MSDNGNYPPHDDYILHVEDDAPFREIVREFLKRDLPDAKHHSAANAEQAQEILATEPVTCVVSDYEMPGASGLELLNTVRADYRALPFILYTGKGSEEIASKALNAGATSYLQKGGADQHRRLSNQIEHGITEYRAKIESQRNSTVLEALQYPVYVVDETERFRYINDVFSDLVGYDRSQLIGSKPAMIKTSDSVEKINEIVPTLVSSSGPDTAQVDITIQRSDGTVVQCRDHIAALPFKEEFHGCAGILRNDAEKKRKAALRDKNDRLENLVAGLSHDLQTPLMTAQGATALMQTDDENVETLTRAHDRIEQILEHLTTVARDGERVTAEQPIELEDVADKAWRTVNATEATLRIEAKTALRADPKQLQRLFENLFTNAVTHAGSDVTVTVDTVSGETTGFTVTDTGPGIPVEHRESVFDSGFTSTEGRTGLGLAIVKRIADAHGWTVHLTNAPHAGAQFRFSGVETNRIDAR